MWALRVNHELQEINPVLWRNRGSQRRCGWGGGKPCLAQAPCWDTCSTCSPTSSLMASMHVEVQTRDPLWTQILSPHGSPGGACFWPSPGLMSWELLWRVGDTPQLLKRPPGHSCTQKDSTVKRRGHLGWTHRAAALFPFLLHFYEDALEEVYGLWG